MDSFAIIFDMDGTLINNNPYHFKAWKEFYRKFNKELSENEYKEKISGVPAYQHLQQIIGQEIDEALANSYIEEKEALYRVLYRPHLTPISGLLPFLEELKAAQVKTAIASSARPDNIRFAFDLLPIEDYFDSIIDSSQIKKGKPDPEIYLKAAEQLGVEPQNCFVFEDSLSGLQGALSAGMRVIGISTSHSAVEMKPYTANTFADYRELNIGKLLDILYSGF